jgi:hypothetical protein
VQTEAEEIPPTPCCVSRRCRRPRSRPAASQRNTKAGLLFTPQIGGSRGAPKARITDAKSDRHGPRRRSKGGHALVTSPRAWPARVAVSRAKCFIRAICGSLPLNSGDFVHDLPYAHRTSKPNGVATCDGGHSSGRDPISAKISNMPAKTIKVVHFQLGHIASSSLRCIIPNIAPNEIEGWDRARRKVQWTIRTFVGRTPTSKETCRGRRRQDVVGLLVGGWMLVRHGSASRSHDRWNGSWGSRGLGRQSLQVSRQQC